MANQLTLAYFKGINTKTSDMLMTDEELKQAVNVDLSKYGIIQKRAGYVQRGDTLTQKVLGLFPYYNSDGTSQLIVATNDSGGTNLVIKARTTGNYTTTLATISGKEDAKLSAVNFINYLFVVGYDDTDLAFVDTGSWDGTTWSTATNLSNAPDGKFIDVVNGYLCIANGQDQNLLRATSRVWWANPPTTLPLALTWNNSDNWWDFEPHNGEEITGIKSNFNRLLVFKNTSLFAFDPVGQDSKALSMSIGCDAYRTIQNVDKFTLFYNRKGVYATNGSDIQLISNPVEKFIEAIDQDIIYNLCAGVKDNKYYHLFIGNVTVDDITYTNCELVYDILQNSWTTNELADIPTIYCNYVQLNL